MNWTISNSNLRPGDIILITKKENLLDKLSNLMFKKVKPFYLALGVVEVWGNIFAVYNDEGTLRLVNIESLKNNYKFKVKTPKKIYSKKEANQFCRSVWSIDYSLKDQNLIKLLANIVRPNTFEKSWINNLIDIDLNRYYKEKFIKHD